MISATYESTVQDFITTTNAIQSGMIEGLESVGKLIVDLASQLAPEETGALKTSGESALVGTAVDISFGNDLPDDRAIAQEFGTVYTAAQPYLSVAVKEIDIVEEIAVAIRRRLI